MCSTSIYLPAVAARPPFPSAFYSHSPRGAGECRRGRRLWELSRGPSCSQSTDLDEALPASSAPTLTFFFASVDF
eukprot:scaffold78701_cov37-Tisochrysis_lutea.AAC.2